MKSFRILTIRFMRCIQDGYRPAERNHELLSQQHLRRALLYVHHHFRENVTLAEAASRAGFTPNYFSECFHQAMGISFQNYLLALRLRLSKSLLRASDMSVTEICYASGFHTLSHFQRVFKRQYGLTPSAYRRTGQRPLIG